MAMAWLRRRFGMVPNGCSKDDCNFPVLNKVLGVQNGANMLNVYNVIFLFETFQRRIQH